MAKNRKNICVLDVGNTKAAALVANTTKPGFPITGHALVKSHGMRGGIITSIADVEKSIVNAIEAAEHSSDSDITCTYFNLPTDNLLFKKYTTSINTAGSQITNKDVQKLLMSALAKSEHEDIVVIHHIPLQYTLDGNTGIESPLGMFGNHLSCEYLMISTPLSYVMNIESCLNKCQIELEEFIAEPISLSKALNIAGGLAIVLNIGSGSSSIIMYKDGNITDAATIALGGTNITNDIAQVLNITTTAAERLKTLHADLDDLDTTTSLEVELDDAENPQFIEQKILNQVVRARVEEILELLYDKYLSLDPSGGAKPNVYIAGGSANLTGIAAIVEEFWGSEVKPIFAEHEGLPVEMQTTSFLNITGMIRFLEERHNATTSLKPQDGVMKQAWHWVKKNLVG